jgi:hypothetical protein
MGAQTQIFLSASRSLSMKDAGKFYDNSREAKTSDEAMDMELADWLWQESRRLTGYDYPTV